MAPEQSAMSRTRPSYDWHVMLRVCMPWLHLALQGPQSSSDTTKAGQGTWLQVLWSDGLVLVQEESAKAWDRFTAPAPTCRQDTVRV